MSPSKMKPGTPKLSEVTRLVAAPTGIVSTMWPAVEDTCRTKLGILFDPWQNQSGRLALAKRADGKMAATIDGVGMSICRQAGKTHWMTGLIFGLSINRPGTLTVWSAHHARTHGETFLAMAAFAERLRVAPFVEQVFRGSGEEEIRFRNGSRILFGARERGFGRGIPGVDVIVADEAQIMSENAVDAMTATMNTSDFGLAFYIGTPPRPADPSDAFTRMRSEAWNGTLSDGVWIEFGAEPGSDPNSPETWRAANPSFPHRTPTESMLRLQRKLSPESFLREGLGIWDESAAAAVVSSVRWGMLKSVGPEAGLVPDAFGVDMSHDRQISIAACWMGEEKAHIEEVWAGPNAAGALQWLVERAKRKPIVIDNMSPAAAFIPELKARRKNVVASTAGDMAKACGMFEDRATSGALSHGDQPQVNDALAGAKKRDIRDAGGWGWDRRDPSKAIYPLVAVTLALFGAAGSRRRDTTRKSRKAVIG